MTAGFSVKTEVFEGPLDLLLELVSKRKLFVNDVSLSEVADDFIRHISEMEEYSLSLSAEFILVASTLMLIKSRSLLPMLELTEEEEESIHDLENRLLAYSQTQELAKVLKSLFGKSIIFEKLPARDPLIVFSPDSKTNPAEILMALECVIASLPKKEVLSKVTVKKVISLEEMIENLSERIAKSGKMYFKDLEHKDKVSMIVGFLAMLELVKRGIIHVKQSSPDEIEIEHA